MTAKTWNASKGSLLDPANWTPTGVPTAADTADQFSGTSYLVHATFPTTLELSGGAPGDATLDVCNSRINVHLGGGGPVGVGYGTINVHNSTVNMHVAGGGDGAGSFIVNIDRSSVLKGTLTMAGSPSGGSSLVINGGTYKHTGLTTLPSNDVVTLNTTTIGNGSWSLGYLTSLTVHGALRQSVTVDGGVLDLELPRTYTGAVTLDSNTADNPAVELSNLFATAASYHKGVLTLDHGSAVIDKLKVGGSAFRVYQTSTGVQIADSTSYVPPSGATLLLHT